MELYALYKSQLPSIKYVAKPLENDTTNPASESDLLTSEKKRIENAMEKLKSLYLYSEGKMSEKEYIIEKTKLSEQLSQIENRLSEISRSNDFSIANDSFTLKASYFLLTQSLSGKRFISYRKLLEEIDPRILKDFINSVTCNFCIENGKIRSITFRNGITHEFEYNDTWRRKSLEPAWILGFSTSSNLQNYDAIE